MAQSHVIGMCMNAYGVSAYSDVTSFILFLYSFSALMERNSGPNHR